MSFTLKRPWTLIPACFRPASSPFDLYNTTVNGAENLMLPINTGIPVSCNDTRELMAYMNPRTQHVRGKTHEYRNLMHNHNQIGVYSSCDEADNPGELEEVEVFTSLDQIQRSEEPMSLDRALPSEDVD